MDESEVILALKRAEKMRIDFVANVSHELRTPLTSIKGYTDTLIQDMNDGINVNPDFLRIISRNVDRVILLIDDLLDLSSIESGADQLKPETVQVDAATSHVISNLQHFFDAKKQTLTVQNKTDTVYADPKRIEQVMTNLLENASKYCPEYTKIHMSWFVDSLSGHTVLEIQDNGPGISEKHQKRLFERFYRVDKGRSRELGGTGLGLAIVKHVMQRHKGNVTVHSELGKGTRFRCEFGLVASDAG